MAKENVLYLIKVFCLLPFLFFEKLAGNFAFFRFFILSQKIFFHKITKKKIHPNKRVYLREFFSLSHFAIQHCNYNL